MRLKILQRKRRKARSLKAKQKDRSILSILLLVIIAQVLFILYLLPKQQEEVVKEEPTFKLKPPVIKISTPNLAPGHTNKSQEAISVQTPQRAKSISPAPKPSKPSETAFIKPSPKKTPENKNIQLAKLPVEIIPKILPPKKIKGKIAIVLDDWGYNANHINILSQIKQPLTLAILPNLPYSKRIAYEAKRRNFEVILHLPLEPYPQDDLVLEKNTITTDMDEVRIKAILAQQISSIPYLKGVNNHMGSKATEDTRTMRIVLKILKKRKLYFLDSVTSASVCSKVARELKIRFAKRDIFLDNQEDAEYISSQLDELKEQARSQGYAIGIGHDRRVTLEVLRDKLPKLQKEGYKFVTVSELLY